MRIARRVKVHIGLRCNAKCRFCYYWDKLDLPNPETQEIKDKLLYARRQGINDIDLSGGEPTIREDLPELISYAKGLGFRCICIITNGIRLADKNYFKKLVECGLNDILFSLEGHTAEIHEYLTRIPGSFEKINKSISYAKEFGIKFRTNATVTTTNYQQLPQLAEYLVTINPQASNFILFNDWCSAHKIIRDMACKYSDAAPYIKKAIDILNPQIKKITIRYIPFCFMLGYERYVCDLLQKEFDSDEWVDSVKFRLLFSIKDKRKAFSHWKNLLKEIALHPFVYLKYIKFDPDVIVRIFHRSAIEQMRRGYMKSKGCKECKFFFICDALEKNYVQRWGLDELVPQAGKKIRDPHYYRGDYGQ